MPWTEGLVCTFNRVRELLVCRRLGTASPCLWTVFPVLPDEARVKRSIKSAPFVANIRRQALCRGVSACALR